MTQTLTAPNLTIGEEAGVSDWFVIDQASITQFGHVTLDPDPMHIDPDWAERGPFGGTIAFGFQTVSLLTAMMHSAMGTGDHRPPSEAGFYLNYGFNKLRLIAPIPVGARVRGRFTPLELKYDDKSRLMAVFRCVIEIEGEERPALVADWITLWTPPGAVAL